MIALDYSVVIQIVAFLLLWFVLAKLVFKPFLALLEERERRTEGVKGEAASLMEELERLKQEYEGRSARAREEGSALKETIVREAEEARHRVLTQARGEAHRAIEMVRGEIRGMMQREREIAAREAGAIAQQMAEKILGRKIG